MISKPYKIVLKQWGRELWLANGPGYCGKVLEIWPDKQTSLHYHEVKHETLYVAEGRAVIWLREPGRDKAPPVAHVMEAGSLIQLQPYTEHAIGNIGERGIVRLFEASTQHFEYDSIRIPAQEDYLDVDAR